MLQDELQYVEQVLLHADVHVSLHLPEQLSAHQAVHE